MSIGKILGQNITDDGKTKLLLHLDGEDGATTSIDSSSSGHALTFSGTAELDTAIKKFGISSASFNAGAGKISAPFSTDFQLTNEDFTIDLQAQTTTVPTGSYYTLVSNWLAEASARSYLFFIFNEAGVKYLAFYYSTDGISANITIKSIITTSWTDNVMHHVAVERYNDRIYLYLDGTKLNGAGTDVSGVTFFNSTYPLDVGRRSAGTEAFQGWLDEVRLSKGIGRYQGVSFTPPTSAYNVNVISKISSKVITDTDTKLLLHGDGADGSISHPITFVGTAQLDTAQKKFGTGSLYCDASGDYISAPTSSDWDFINEDFTLDCWAMWDNLPTDGNYKPLFNKFSSVGNNRAYYFSLINSGGTYYLRLTYTTDGTNTTIVNLVSSAITPSADTWYHIALVRSGTTIYFFVDGILKGTETIGTVYNALRALEIGGGSDFSLGHDGWIDELRISKGIARWTSNFTPSTSKYQSDEYTTLLLNFNGADGATFTDDESGGDVSTQNHIVTYNGTAQLDTAQSKFGSSSLLLDGNSDYLTVPDSADWEILANNTDTWTVDFWMYPNGVSAQQDMIVHFQDNSNYWRMELASSALSFYSITTGVSVGGGTPVASQWQHVAFIIKGTGSTKNIGIYLDGTQVAYASHSGNQSIAGNLYIGQKGDSTLYFNGWMDEIRIQKSNYFNASPNVGITDTITVPTSAYNVNVISKISGVTI